VDAERDGFNLVTALQDAVQPAGVPVLPIFDLEGRYCVSSNASEPGGNWFEIAVLPDDRLAMIVGEAPGIGMTPSVAAAQMSAVIRAGLRRDGDVVTALQLADLHAEDHAASRGTAAAVVLLDPDRGTATYATAGHPPPVLLPALGRVTLLSDTGGGPFGTGAGTGYRAGTFTLSSGDGVLLASAAVHRAAALMPPGDAGDSWPDVAFADLNELSDRLARWIAVDDTLCLVAARLRPSPHPPLAVQLQGGGDLIRLAREELGAWLTELHSSPMDRMALTHAAAELVTNAVKHGGRGEDRQVELNARLRSDGYVQVEVSNHGSWQVPPDDPGSGRGLAMAAGLVDHLGISTHPSGTRALLQHRLVRPVAIETSEQVASSHANDAVEVIHSAPRTVSLRGAVNHDDVERITAEILLATRGGTLPLSLDLTGVTRLSTSAVRLLADFTSVKRAVGLDTANIDIITTMNSPTQRALEVARVPHHAA
jgi:anti-sigma regulatory factor (Ser/Thr protein kinase)/anti-anti-sigma regulatory factor